MNIKCTCFYLFYRRNRHANTVNRNPLLFDASPFRDPNKPGALIPENSPLSRGGTLIYTPEHNYTTTLHPKRPLPVPSPLVPLTDANLTDMQQCKECNIAHTGPPPAGMLDRCGYPVHMGNPPPRATALTSTGPTSTPSSTGTSKNHIYETPTFPIQQMAREGGRIHSADGISRGQVDSGEDGRSSRTN